MQTKNALMKITVPVALAQCSATPEGLYESKISSCQVCFCILQPTAHSQFSPSGPVCAPPIRPQSLHHTVNVFMDIDITHRYNWNKSFQVEPHVWHMQVRNNKMLGKLWDAAMLTGHCKGLGGSEAISTIQRAVWMENNQLKGQCWNSNGNIYEFVGECAPGECFSHVIAVLGILQKNHGAHSLLWKLLSGAETEKVLKGYMDDSYTCAKYIELKASGSHNRKNVLGFWRLEKFIHLYLIKRATTLNYFFVAYTYLHIFFVGVWHPYRWLQVIFLTKCMFFNKPSFITSFTAVQFEIT